MARRTIIALLMVVLAACSGGTDAEPDSAAEPATTTAGAPTTEAPEQDEAPDDISAGSTEAPETPAAPAEANPAALTDLPGQLAVVRDDGSLEILGPDGNNRVGLDSSEGRRAAQPAWAPDASRVSWTSSGVGQTALRIHTFGESGDVEIPTTSPVFYSAWDATTNRVATLRSAGAGIQFDIHDVGGDTLPIAVGQPFYFDWADDGASVLLAVNNRNVARVEVDEFAGGDVGLSSGLAAFQSPSVLPDDSFVVALRDPAGAARVVRIGADGSEEPLARFNGAIAMASSPDGTRLAVLVSPDPSEPQLQQAAFQLLPDLPSGRISVIDLAAGTVETLPHRDVAAISWSPDGRWLAGLQVRDGAAQWVLDDGAEVVTGPSFVPSTAFATEYLPFFDQYNQSHRWWSPDGAALVLAGAIDGEPGIWIDVVADAGPPIRITDGSIAIWSPQ